MLFADSRPDRKKRDPLRRLQLEASPVPAPKPYDLLCEDDLHFQNRTLVWDSELYPNYFLIAFKCITTGKAIFFEDSEDHRLDVTALAFVMNRFLLIGFNSERFDRVLAELALMGHRAAELHKVAMQIIKDNTQSYEIEREYQIRKLKLNHIDLFDVAPLDGSLKIYAGRLHCPRMQDLPFQPNTLLTREQAAIVRDYCINDLDNTALLYHHLLPQIALRENLGRKHDLDLRSKSEAQIAEAVIASELDKLKRKNMSYSKTKKIVIDPGWSFKFNVPDYMRFQTPQLQHILETVRNATFIVGNGGKAVVPEEIQKLKFTIGQTNYQMKGGGLHSREKHIAHKVDANTLLIDRDVASYYPQIILNQGLYPQHLGPDFLIVYSDLVLSRLKDKEEKRTEDADSKKIIVNGTFGQFGNVFSKTLYAPDLLMQVTMSGQLFVLMLIELIELAGIPVISGNTDGIIIKCPVHRFADLELIIAYWQLATGFKTEETRYQAVYSRDINNYIAVKLNGDCKTKGVYTEKGSALNSALSKNPECLIVTEAVQAFLAHGKPLAVSIGECKDVRKFVAVRTVKGGAEKNGVYLGKAIRWYYAHGEEGTINYADSGNIVAKTKGAKPLMLLPAALKLPPDIDLDYYLNEARETLFDVGFLQRPERARLL